MGTRTIRWTRYPLDTPILTKIKYLYDEIPEVPVRVWVPRSRLVAAAETIRRVWDEAAPAIDIVTHEASMSWAVVGTTLTVMVIHPTTPSHKDR